MTSQPYLCGPQLSQRHDNDHLKSLESARMPWVPVNISFFLFSVQSRDVPCTSCATLSLELQQDAGALYDQFAVILTGLVTFGL